MKEFINTWPRHVHLVLRCIAVLRGYIGDEASQARQPSRMPSNSTNCSVYVYAFAPFISYSGTNADVGASFFTF